MRRREKQPDCSNVLSIPRVQLRLIERWSHEVYPAEACGVLIGWRDRGTTGVTWARNVLNPVRCGCRFMLHPNDLAEADMAARRMGLDVVGIWHSHPDHDARPSELDRRLAWSAWSYLIVSIGASDAVEVRSWVFEGSNFTEEIIASWPG